MSGPLVYIDTSEVRPGALEELKPAIDELVEFIDANEPQLVSYGVYLNDDGTQMTVVHMHADPASLDFHMNVAGPVFPRFAELITMTSIHIYGEPSESALAQLHDKARLLGCQEVKVQALRAGITRFGQPESAGI